MLGGLIVYSQTWAFSWDEGFHLLTAQLIIGGKRPWIDFLFPQTPLNAYWNAAWMRLLGENWRVTHVLAALETTGTTLLTADYLFTRFPVPRWKLAAALTGAFLVALNAEVVSYATIGQAYGLALLLIVAAFRMSILAVDQTSPALAALAGLLAGAAAGCTLLTAVVAPTLLIWIFLFNRAGNRTLKVIAFVVASAIPFLPVFRLAAQGPHQALFNLIRYQTLFRSVNWGHPWQQQFKVFVSWIDSAQALSLGLLAAGGVWFVAKRSEWDRARRAEFFLCGWLALTITAELFSALPTFQRYFLLIVPFLAILAAAGLYAGSTLFLDDERPLWPVLGLGLLIFAGFVKSTYDDRDSFTWPEMERVAAKTAEVTPSGASLWADELTYFLTRRSPPPGMEFAYAHKLEMPEPERSLLHVLPNSVIKERLAAGAFSTVETCDNEDVIEGLGLAKLYAQQAKVDDCVVFWQPRPPLKP
jgi:4-amino-4-deoxy-L-arabinose transferase-like glycosyltransferase